MSREETEQAMRAVKPGAQLIPINRDMTTGLVERTTERLPYVEALRIGDQTTMLEVKLAIPPDESRAMTILRTDTLDGTTSQAVYREALIKKYGAPPVADETVFDNGHPKYLERSLLWLEAGSAPYCGGLLHIGVRKGVGTLRPYAEVDANPKVLQARGVKAEDCSIVLAFFLKGDPVTSAKSVLIDTGKVSINIFNSKNYFQDLQRKVNEAKIQGAKSAPKL
jgi:hypothetical protein